MAALRGDGFARLRPPRAQRTPGRKDKDTPVSNEREPRSPGLKRRVPRTHQPGHVTSLALFLGLVNLARSHTR
ncbi:hypothetical protein STEG23_018491 [Scotinomys teguina]